MNIIKNLKIILAGLLLCVGAVSADARFRWGPELGVNISNLYWKQNLVSSTQLCGPTAGIKGELMIPGIGFGIDIGLRYQMNGAHVGFGSKKIWSSSGYEDQNVWIHTLQIPLDLRFKWTRMDGFEDYLAPFVFVGPVFSFNCGTNKAPMVEVPAGTIDLQFGLGAEIFQHFQVSADYYIGLSYQTRTIKLDNFSARQRGWNVNLTYLF